MARGWESKDVESRQESFMRVRDNEQRALLSAEERARQSRRDMLALQRTRILGELQRCCQPRFRGQLESELAFLDTEIAKLA